MMAVISTFDQWQKDVFFSAAEEVQESADAMESMYRMWVLDRINGLEPEISDELRRELHTTLGTAKWQLEEFERAVSSENTITRHREFIDAIRDKISHIEKAIDDSLIEEGKQPLRWVQLDKEERDDFEMFLTSAPKSLPLNKEKQADHEYVRGFKETVTINKDAKYTVEVAAKDTTFRNRDEVMLQEDYLSEQKKEESSLDIDGWKILISDEEDTPNRPSSLCSFVSRVGLSAKLRGFQNSFHKAKSREHIQTRRRFSNYLDLKGITMLTQGINRLSERSRSCFSDRKEVSKGCSVQQIGSVGGLQRQFQGLQSNRRSLRVTLLLVLTVFLIVPFVLYST